jgi:hypothetical protein
MGNSRLRDLGDNALSFTMPTKCAPGVKDYERITGNPRTIPRARTSIGANLSLRGSRRVSGSEAVTW